MPAGVAISGMVSIGCFLLAFALMAIYAKDHAEERATHDRNRLMEELAKEDPRKAPLQHIPTGLRISNRISRIVK